MLLTFRDILAVLRIARVALIIGLLTALGIYLPEQSAELFRIMTDELGMQIILFAGATVFAAVALWSWSDRLLDLLPARLRRGTGVGSTIARALPIGLALLPITVTVLVLLAVVTGGPRSPAGKIALCAAISTFGAAAALLILRLRKKNRRDAAAWMTALISAGQFLIFCFLPGWVASWFGTAAIFMLWTGCLAVAASALAILGSRTRLPLFTVLLLIALTLSYFDLNDNHVIRHERRAPEYVSGSHIEDLKFRAWLNARKNREKFEQYPVFIISAEGGGIRAAYFTALVLAAIQDRCPAFAQHVFAISGVSGGSIGAAVFSALAKRLLTSDERDDCPAGLDAAGRFQRHADAILGRDHLAPVVAAMLFPDLVQRFLPWGIGWFDRARALEQALEQAWTEETNGREFSESFFALWGNQWQEQVPALVLNTTSVETGMRMAISHFNIWHEDISPLESLWNVNSKITVPLSTAAVLSARFPLVTPAGSIYTDEPNKPDEKRRYVDGGYFENTGTSTVHDLINGIRLHALPAHLGFELYVIRIGSEDALPQYGGRTLSEIASPVMTLLNTREARGAVAKAQVYTTLRALRRAAPGARSYGLFEFDLRKRQVPLPLGWILSKSARQEMIAQISTSGLAKRVPGSRTWNCNGEDNYCEMQRVLDVLRARKS